MSKGGAGLVRSFITPYSFKRQNQADKRPGVNELDGVMKRALSTLVLFFLLIPLLHAQSEEGVITGTIYDEEGNTVSNASVAIYDSTECNIVTGASSDSSGTFNIEVDPEAMY